MSVRNAGTTIREARLKAGLTLEQMADTICSTQALCRIEKGRAGVSPSTFHALMDRAGYPCSAFPVFENWTDYQCFSHFNRAKLYLNAWQLEKAYVELDKIEELHWNNNKLNYQEWLLLEAKLYFRSYQGNHEYVFKLLSTSLHITKPTIDLFDFRGLLFSITEIELLIYLAQELLYMNELTTVFSICTQLETYLNNCSFSDVEKEFLLAELAVVFSKYLLATHDYQAAVSTADKHRHTMVVNGNNAPLLELNFLTALGYYYTNQDEIAFRMFKDTYYAAHAIKSVYSTVCLNYIRNELHLFLNDEIMVLDSLGAYFPQKEIIDFSDFTEGIYDLDDTVLTFGRLIQELRIQQNVSQQVLCQGLCSKSKLSKIENGSLQPDVLLAETLLQRLGVSERDFSFWTNSNDQIFFDLKFSLLHSEQLLSLDCKKLLSRLSQFKSSNNLIKKQYAIFSSALLSKSYNESLEYILAALSLTKICPSTLNINSQKLSWYEFSMLNNLAYSYRFTNTPFIGNGIFHKLFEYKANNNLEPRFLSETFSITLYKYARFLYSQKRHGELFDIYLNTDISILYHQMSTLAGFLFYVCQTNECIAKEKKYLHTILYTCALKNINEKVNDYDILIHDLMDEFSISIQY